MRKMVLAPDASGYSSQDGEDVIRVQLDGGAGRYRTDKIGSTKIVNVKWTLLPEQYEYWRAFFTTGTQNGALPFLCDLVSEDAQGPAEHVCRFIPGSVSLPTQQGLMYVQQATLEVKPLPRDVSKDNAILMIWENSGGNPDYWLLSIERLVNIIMPETIGG